MTLSSLLNTSVSDAKISLENAVARDPVSAGHTALDLLEQLRGMEGHASRRKVAAGILRKAAKKLSEEQPHE